MANPFLLLWLEGSLQSWGSDSRFGRRGTLDFPTKSGVLGLVLSALGASGEQRELLADFAPLTQTVVSYRRSDRPEPALRDFQMVGSGYDDGDPWATLLVPKRSDGTKPNGAGTKMTYRFYLQDARFAVALEVPEARADDIAEALQYPVYDVFLGRKCCAPTDLIYRGTHADADEALATGQVLADEKGLVAAFRVVGGEADGEALTLNDVPIQFGEHKLYRDRRVTVVT